MNIKQHKFVLLVGDHYNPLGMVRSLGEVGITPDVVLVAETPYLVSASKYVDHLKVVHTAKEGIDYILSTYICEKEKTFLLTGSDDIVAEIDKHYNRLIDNFYFFNAGSQGRINQLLSKSEQNKLAKSCGFNVPEFEEVIIGEKPRNVSYPLITKAIDSTIGNWKSQVYICRNEMELFKAYSKLNCKRILLQQYIEKKNETGFDALSIKGGEETYLPLQLTYHSITDDNFGHSIYFFQPTDMAFCEKIKRIIMKTQFTGIFSIDFLEGKDGKLYFLEINFRNSAWSYPSTKAGVNLPVIWASSVLKDRLDLDGVVIKKTPYSAIVETTELMDGIRKGVKGTLAAIKRIKQSDSYIFWNEKDNAPFWATIKYALKSRLENLLGVSKNQI